MNLLKCTFLASLLAVLGTPAAVACSTLTQAGEAKRARAEQRYLRKHSDKIVLGTWHLETKGNQENDYRDTGVIVVTNQKKTSKYRVSVPGEINCGFPFYYLEDGDRGHFYLKRTDYPEEDDAVDGFIDDYKYVHMKTLKSKEK